MKQFHTSHEHLYTIPVLTLLPRIWLIAALSFRVHSATTFALISFMYNIKAFRGFLMWGLFGSCSFLCSCWGFLKGGCGGVGGGEEQNKEDMGGEKQSICLRHQLNSGWGQHPRPSTSPRNTTNLEDQLLQLCEWGSFGVRKQPPAIEVFHKKWKWVCETELLGHLRKSWPYSTSGHSSLRTEVLNFWEVKGHSDKLVKLQTVSPKQMHVGFTYICWGLMDYPCFLQSPSSCPSLQTLQ